MDAAATKERDRADTPREKMLALKSNMSSMGLAVLVSHRTNTPNRRAQRMRSSAAIWKGRPKGFARPITINNSTAEESRDPIKSKFPNFALTRDWVMLLSLRIRKGAKSAQDAQGHV